MVKLRQTRIEGVLECPLGQGMTILFSEAGRPNASDLVVNVIESRSSRVMEGGFSYDIDFDGAAVTVLGFSTLLL